MIGERGVCPVCERRVALRQDGSGLRRKHYINETRLFSYELKVCRGSDPHGSRPLWSTIDQAKKDGPKITCPCCDQKVPRTKDFRPARHKHKRTGRDCPGWVHNDRRR